MTVHILVEDSCIKTTITDAVYMMQYTYHQPAIETTIECGTITVRWEEVSVKSLEEREGERERGRKGARERGRER